MTREAEQSVLGSMILDNECISLVTEMLTPEMFMDATHRTIFTGVVDLSDQGIDIDIVQVRNLGVDAQVAVAICEVVPHAASVEHYAKIVIDSYKVSMLRSLAKEIENIAHTDIKPDDMIAQVQGMVTKHTDHDDSKVVDSVADIAKTISFEKGGAKRIPTGVTAIDEIIIGICKTDYVIVAGRPGMGKTSLLLDIAVNMSWYNGFPAAFYTCEMSPKQLVSRMASARCEVPLFRIEKGYATPVEKDNMYEAARQMETCPLYIKKTGGITPMGLKRKISADKRKYGIKAAFVDYLQLLQPDQASRSQYEDITSISRAIKQVVIQTGVPIIMGSQLKRTEHAKKPTMTDFRGSGAIEEDADIIIALHRDSYYTPDEPDELAEAIILKGRHFGSGKADLRFIGSLTHFVDRGGV
jgi:replicative DNA helicase